MNKSMNLIISCVIMVCTMTSFIFKVLEKSLNIFGTNTEDQNRSNMFTLV